MAKILYYSGKTICIATMHKKEAVISPLVETALGASTYVPADFDTDVFGTFSLEIKRRGSQYDALRKKAQVAYERYKIPLVITSEGAFYPNPETLGLTYLNRELIMFKDFTGGLEVVGSYTSPTHNYRTRSVETLTEGLEFLKDIDFPRHGVLISYRSKILRRKTIYKDCVTLEEFSQQLELALKKSFRGKVLLLSDMRAHKNPTRMQAIGMATANMLGELTHLCPKCASPGCTVTALVPGASCLTCGSKTGLPLEQTRLCQKCGHTFNEPYTSAESLATLERGCTNCNA